jgi:hypothetical protein
LPQCLDVIQRNLYGTVIDFTEGIHLLLLFPGGMCLPGFEKLDVVSPYLSAVLILPDMIQCKLVGLADGVTRRCCRTSVNTS